MMCQAGPCYHITHFKAGRLPLTAVELPLSGPFSLVLVKTETFQEYDDADAFPETGANRYRAEQFGELVHLLVGCKLMPNVRRAMSKDSIHLFVPRFSVEWEAPLQDILVDDLNFPLAFDQHRAEFNRICFNSPVWLSGAVHKTVITIDEEGCEAAPVGSVNNLNHVTDVAFDSSFFGAIVYTPPSAAGRQQAVDQGVSLFCFAVQNAPEHPCEQSAASDNKPRAKTTAAST